MVADPVDPFIPLQASRGASSGRGDRTRTGDFLLPKQARYQLRHTPHALAGHAEKGIALRASAPP